jgi:GNAT superfamily N-acetyltransferase
MNDYEIIDRKPTPGELEELRKAVQWGVPDREALEIGLFNSLFGVIVSIEGKVIGTLRIVGDGKTCFYLQDVIVHPSYQRKGIGKEMIMRAMNYVNDNACKGAVVGLMAAKGKEEFYEKYGFWKRPNEHFGHGMMQFWGK